MGDDAIVIRILGAFIEEAEPDYEKRVEPARKLLDELKPLAESAGYSVTAPELDLLQIVLGRRLPVWVKYTGDARCFHVFSSRTATRYCKLSFESSTGTFYTEELDGRLAPTPGAPLPTKAPLTVLAEVIVEVLGM